MGVEISGGSLTIICNRSSTTSANYSRAVSSIVAKKGMPLGLGSAVITTKATGSLKATFCLHMSNRLG